MDLNADVGEGLDEIDRALLDSITSANVACGAHAGDEATARALCAEARARGITVGAHVGYPDRAGFGRRELALPVTEIEAHVAEQLAGLAEWARPARVAYVKPHGALYHRATVDAECAAALVRAAAAAGIGAVLAFPDSQLLEHARGAGLVAVAEGFADRGYTADGALVARGETGAVLGEEEAVAQGVRLAREGAVGSLCVHGDTPRAAALARRVRVALEADGVDVRPFA